MITVRMVPGLVDSSMIEDIERDLTKVIEDFDRALNVEALRRIKDTGERLFLVMSIHSHCFV